jgi:V8-like Glu-specific endopeptidase
MNKMKVYIPLLILIFSCSHSDRRPANIFDRDDRETIARSQEPGVGRLMKDPTSTYNWGTAFHISKCHVVSAYHVVKDTEKVIDQTDRAYFISPLRENPIEAKPIAWGKPYRDDLNENDWVILELKECLKLKQKDIFSFFSYSNDSELRGRKIELLGFPEDRHPKNIHLDKDCKFGDEVPEKGEGIGHNCATRPGNSGGPLYISNSAGKRHVAAIAVASRGYFVEIIEGYSPWISNTATPAKPIAEAFEDIIGVKSSP